MNQKFRTSAYESEVIKPFQTYNDIFDDCKVMVNEAEGFLDDPNIFIEDGVDCLKLQLKIEQRPLSHELAKMSSNSIVNVFFRDIEGSKNYKKIFSQTLDKLDFKELNLIEEIPSNFLVSNAQIVLTLVKQDDSHSFERLASKTFKFLDYSQALSFPKVPKSPDEFAEAGFFRSAPFALKWIGEDLDKPINQLVELWLNREHELAMQKFGTSNNSFAKTFLGVNVFQEILYDVIIKSIRTNSFEATASITVFKLLSDISITISDVHSLSEKPDFKSIVNTWAMQIMRLEKSFSDAYS